MKRAILELLGLPLDKLELELASSLSEIGELKEWASEVEERLEILLEEIRSL